MRIHYFMIYTYFYTLKMFLLGPAVVLVYLSIPVNREPLQQQGQSVVWSGISPFQALEGTRRCGDGRSKPLHIFRLYCISIIINTCRTVR